MQAREAILGSISIFAHLRPDEIGRVTRHFKQVRLEAEELIEFQGGVNDARLIVVISGLVDVRAEDPAGEILLRMRPGDRYGDSSLVSSNVHRVRIKALAPSELLTLDSAALDRLLDAYPAVALPLVTELASELRTRNDQVRQVAELALTASHGAKIERAMARLRNVIALRSASVRHSNTRGLFRRLIIDRGAEPPFWMLLGFLAGLAGARIVVYAILKYQLEKHFFALVQGQDKNPMHIHHFNYGLVLVGFTGLMALSPTSRRSLRILSTAFGLGCGLIFDEFALFWNLNPDYSQGLSLISSALAFVVLLQLVYFRRFWSALANRAIQKARGE